MKIKIKIKPLSILFVVLFLISIGLPFILTQSYSQVHREKISEFKENFEFEKLKNEILYLDEVVASSARISILSGNSVWEGRYHNFREKLGAALYKWDKRFKDPERHRVAKEINELSFSARRIENQALGIFKMGRVDEASDLLKEEKYLNLRDAFFKGVSFFEGSSDEEFYTERLRSRLLYLDEGTMMSALSAVYSGTTLWMEDYASKKEDLANTLADILKEAPKLIKVAPEEKTIAKIRALEIQAFDLIRNNNIKRAQLLIAGKDYKDTKAIYDEKMKKLLEALEKKSNKIISQKEKTLHFKTIEAYIFNGFILLCWVILFLVWRKRSKLQQETESAKKDAERLRQIAGMSYDIRTSLSAILGFSDLLNRTDLNEEQKNFTDSITKSGRGLLDRLEKLEDEKKPKQGLPQAEGSCEGIKVLIVEDDPVSQALLKALLKKFGCEIDVASNGNEAIDKIRKNTYNVCLMDLQMPVMGGVEATRILREGVNTDIPIIALTAAVMEEDKNQALEAGMNDFLIKPMQPEKIKQTLIKYGRQ